MNVRQPTSEWTPTYHHHHLSPRLLEFVKGCVLAPFLFSCAMDWIMSKCTDQLGINASREIITDLLYADDAALFVRDLVYWPDVFNRFESTAKSLGLKPSWQKTKV